MTDYLETVRQALERFEVATPETIEGQAGIFVAPASLDDGLAVVNAARRYVRLAETGPDYEAAAKALSAGIFQGEIDEVPEVQRKLARLTVDAALADYLTEETE